MSIPNPLRPLLAWRRKQRNAKRAKRLALAYLRTGDRELARVIVKLTVYPCTQSEEVWKDGQSYTCLYCNRRYRQDQHSAWGFCQRCSEGVNA